MVWSFRRQRLCVCLLPLLCSAWAYPILSRVAAARYSAASRSRSSITTGSLFVVRQLSNHQRRPDWTGSVLRVSYQENSSRRVPRRTVAVRASNMPTSSSDKTSSSTPKNDDPPPPSKTTTTSAADNNNNKTTMIVQYIVLRRDLAWPAGAMAAQAAHAAVAALAEALQAGHEPAATYIDPHHLPHMTKYVYGVDNLAQLELVREQWNAQQLTSAHDDDKTTMLHWWVEQPENIPTALATWPVERTNKVSKTIKNMKLTFF